MAEIGREGTLRGRVLTNSRGGASHLDGTPPSCSSASVLKRIEVIVEGYGNRRRQTLSPWHSPEEPRTMGRRRGRLTEKLVAPHAGDAGFPST